MSLYTAMKNLRRRTVESVFQKTGLSEITVDEEFDDMNGNVNEVLQDLNECGAALTSVLKAQKVFFGEARDLTAVVHQIYERSINEKELWPEETNKLNHTQAASLWKEKWDKLHDITRSSSAIVCCDEALDPIKDTINTCIPTLEQDARDRSVILMDFDAHRRRLKAYEAKRDTAGGSNTNTAAGYELQNDIAKYQAKVQASGEEYDRLNNKLKNEMMATKESHDELIETMLITFVTAQVHLFSKVAKELDEILRFFPVAQVREIRSRIDGYESQGGVFADVKEKSTTRKVYEVAVGKSVLSDFKKPSPSDTTTPVQVEGVIVPQEIKSSMASATTVVNNNSNSNNNSNNNNIQGVNMMKVAGNKKTTAPPPAATAASSSSSSSNNNNNISGGKRAIALFAYKAGADDELGFEKDAVIEVVDDVSDAGWWRGRLVNNNRVGIFPANYVELIRTQVPPPVVVATPVTVKSSSPTKPLTRQQQQQQQQQQQANVPMATVFKSPPPPAAATSSSSSSSSSSPSSVSKRRSNNNTPTTTTTPVVVTAITRTPPAPRATPPPAATSEVPLTRTAPPPKAAVTTTTTNNNNISSSAAVIPKARALPPAATVSSTVTSPTKSKTAVNSTAAAPFRKQVMALYAYEAQEDGELSFQKGDVIEVLEDSDEGWWKGQHQHQRLSNNNAIGIFPVNYVKLVNQQR